MFMTLTGELSWQHLRRSAVDVYSKKRKNRFLSHPFWTYGWDVISGNLSKSAFFERGGSLWVQISNGSGRCPPITVGVRKLEWLRFRAVSQCIIWFCHKARVWRTDRRTDRITTPKTALAYLRRAVIKRQAISYLCQSGYIFASVYLLFVCLSVCLSAGFLKKLCINLYKLFGRVCSSAKETTDYSTQLLFMLIITELHLIDDKLCLYDQALNVHYNAVEHCRKSNVDLYSALL